MQTSRSGFSLIEIVIAVMIMAIAASLVVPAVFEQLRKSKAKTTRVALHNVQQAILSYKEEVGSYPQTLDELINRPTDEKLAKRWDGPYIKQRANDAYGNELQYVLNPKGSHPAFDLYSWGGEEGNPEEKWIRVSEE